MSLKAKQQIRLYCRLSDFKYRYEIKQSQSALTNPNRNTNNFCVNMMDVDWK